MEKNNNKSSEGIVPSYKSIREVSTFGNKYGLGISKGGNKYYVAWFKDNDGPGYNIWDGDKKFLVELQTYKDFVNFFNNKKTIDDLKEEYLTRY